MSGSENSTIIDKLIVWHNIIKLIKIKFKVAILLKFKQSSFYYLV